jgi:hypothetical protein
MSKHEDRVWSQKNERVSANKSSKEKGKSAVHCGTINLVSRAARSMPRVQSLAISYITGASVVVRPKLVVRSFPLKVMKACSLSLARGC